MLKTYWKRFYSLALPMYVSVIFMPFIPFIPVALACGLGKEETQDPGAGWMSDATWTTAFCVTILLGLVVYSLAYKYW